MLERVATRVARSSEPLCRAYIDRTCAFRIGLQRSNEINAFASGRDVVGVTSGMLQVGTQRRRARRGDRA